MSYPAEIYVYCSGKWVSISPHGMSTIPLATATDVGGVKIGAGIDVAADGTISTKHFSGDYNDLTNKPIIAAPVQSDWNSAGGDSYILNKPVALSQFNNDLKISDFPNDALYATVPQAAAAAPVQSIIAGANVAISDDGHGHITIASTGTGGGGGGGVASVSGSAPIRVVNGTSAPVVSLNVGAGLKLAGNDLAVDVASITGLATVATSGSYNDLSDKPTIPTKVSDLTNDSAFVDKAGAAAAAPVQTIVAGTNVTVTDDGSGNVTVAAATVPDASTTVKGIVKLADAAAITAGTSGRVVDAAQLKAGDALRVLKAGDTMTGSLVVPDGTAAAPAVKFDDATGIYQPAANTFAISTAGTERLRVQGDGKMSLGNAAPQGSASFLIRRAQDAISVVRLDGAAPTTAGTHYGVYSIPTVAAASPGTYSHFTASQSGAGKFGTSYGFYVDDTIAASGLTAGVATSVTSGTGRWNIYSVGTAPNYFGGQLHITSGTATVPSIVNRSNLGTGVNVEPLAVSAIIGGVEQLRVNAKGQVVIAAGTAALPSLTENGDEDTGVFWPAANNFAISTAGVERLRVKPTGSVRYIPLATAPATPEEGEVYFDSTTKKLRCYNGTAWTDLN